MTTPNVRWTFHGTVLVHDYDAALAWLNRMTGCTALEFSDAGPPVSRRGGCCSLGDNLLELMEPNDPASPGGRYLERFGPGLFNIALQVDDIQAMSDHLGAHGAPVAFPPEQGFTFTRPRDTCGIQFEWADIQGEWDPRFGGAWPSARGLIETPRIAWWGALVSDPGEAVRRLNALWPAPVLHLDPSAPPDRIAAALSLGDGVLALYRLPETLEEERALWGVATGKARTHLIALRVTSLADACVTLTAEGVRLLRESADEIVTRPEDCHGLVISWTERDLSGDPRGPLRPIGATTGSR
ncbi:MAG: VOC family protein [Sphingomonadaceae bacterium]|nr:VOC family protein [Sphingomonadaceae bacterium]